MDTNLIIPSHCDQIILGKDSNNSKEDKKSKIGVIIIIHLQAHDQQLRSSNPDD